ncbi:MAG: phosphorylase [Syntrophomonadaceae bacterium]
MLNIPECDFAFIGGSSTLSIEVPESLDLDYVEVVDKGLVFPTPYGRSPEFKYLRLDSAEGPKRIISCRMHGWRSGVSRAQASLQIFWVFRNAGVKKILAEGGVGAINYLLDPRDLIIPHDYIDFSLRKDVGLSDKYLLIMREALCPEMRACLAKVSREKWPGRWFDRSIYANTDGRHFESPAEINLCKLAGADVVGQSLCPEVYLAREIGACYAGVHMVVNHAEGILAPWRHGEMEEIFYHDSKALAGLVFEALKVLPIEKHCSCETLRKETLLKEVYKDAEEEDYGI